MSADGAVILHYPGCSPFDERCKNIEWFHGIVFRVPVGCDPRRTLNVDGIIATLIAGRNEMRETNHPRGAAMATLARDALARLHELLLALERPPCPVVRLDEERARRAAR